MTAPYLRQQDAQRELEKQDQSTSGRDGDAWLYFDTFIGKLMNVLFIVGITAFVIALSIFWGWFYEE